MPLLTAVLPDVPPEEFNRLPLRERLRLSATFWADNGFGTPRYVHVLYILKVVVLYAGGGLLVVSLTGAGGLGRLGEWWDAPVVYPRLAAWTMLLEVVGVAGAWGPLCGHFKPFTAPLRYWLRTGTVRVAPWRLPGTAGDTRTPLDVGLYAALLASLVLALVVPVAEDGLPPWWATLLPVVLLALNGLRDSIVFLAARGEQYVPALVLASLLGPVDMVIAAKVLIVVVWMGAGASKLGRHFVNVVPPMVSNAPFFPRFVRRLHYRSRDDLRPSRLAWVMAHVGGTVVELVTPVVLLVSTSWPLTLAAVCLMLAFHLFIVLTFPLAVPLEWNVAFGFLAAYLFLGHPAGAGYGLGDFSHPWALVLIALALVAFPVLGNLRPDLVSFLPSMRQYAGNWASAVWAFAPGAEARMARLGLPVADMSGQLRALLGYDEATAEQSMCLVTGWRAMHSQGRGLYSVLLSRLDDIDARTIREGEFMAAYVRGWNFGDGHLHDERLVAAVQARAGFAPGELVVAYVESQPIHRGVQEYRVIDAALGVVERGTWRVRDAVAQQPWLPDGPIPLQVTWRAAGTGSAGAA